MKTHRIQRPSHTESRMEIILGAGELALFLAVLLAGRNLNWTLNILKSSSLDEKWVEYFDSLHLFRRQMPTEYLLSGRPFDWRWWHMPAIVSCRGQTGASQAGGQAELYRETSWKWSMATAFPAVQWGRSIKEEVVKSRWKWHAYQEPHDGACLQGASTLLKSEKQGMTEARVQSLRVESWSNSSPVRYHEWQIASICAFESASRHHCFQSYANIDNST